MKYQPHTLIAKADLADFSKGSRLIYLPDYSTSTLLTYGLNSRRYELSLEDATNSQYFEMAVQPQPPPALPPALVQPWLLSKLWQAHPASIITAIIGLVILFCLDVGGPATEFPGLSTAMAIFTLGLWLSIGLIARKLSGTPTNKLVAGAIIAAGYVAVLALCIAAADNDGSRVRMGFIDYCSMWLAFRIMRLS